MKQEKEELEMQNNSNNIFDNFVNEIEECKFRFIGVRISLEPV